MSTVRVCIGLLASCAKSKYRAQISNCKGTWMKDAAALGIPVHFFCGSVRSDKHPTTEYDPVSKIVPRMIHFNAGDDYKSATDKQWYGLAYLYSVYVKCDFYLIAGTDNYVECAKLLEELKELDASKPLYIGGHTGRQDVGYKLAFHFGGGGIILSRAALEKLDIVNRSGSYIKEWEEKCKSLPNGKELLPACDVALAFFSERVNLGFVSKTGMYACNWMGKLEGSHCCHLNYPELITCHFMDDNMYTYHLIKGEMKKEWYRNRIVMYYTLAKGVTNHLASHIPTLYQLSADCNKVLQFRRTADLSCVPFVRALYENKDGNGGIIYTIDEEKPLKAPMTAPFPDIKVCDPITELPKVASGLGVSYVALYGNSPDLVPEDKYDIMFIETELASTVNAKLEKHGPYITRYIIVHSIGKNTHAPTKEIVSNYACSSPNFVVAHPSCEDLTVLKRVESTSMVREP